MMETRIVPFYGDSLVAAQEEDGAIRVALKPMCDALGLDARAQQRRIQRQPWGEGAAIMAAPSFGGEQRTFLLPLATVPMWLATVEARRVRAEVFEKLVRYQREAHDVLARAFVPQVAPAAPMIVSLGEVEDLRRRVAAMELDRWHFTYSAIVAQQHDLDDLRRQVKQLRAGARVQATGRRGGTERKTRHRAAKALGPATPLLPLPGGHA